MTDAIALSLVLFVSTYVQGYMVTPKDSGNMIDSSSGRVKRMSQISCHCCSLSFNSHCCLKCMSRLRIGRRSTETNYNDDHQLTDHSNAIEDNINSTPEKTPKTDDSKRTQATLCTCCMEQIIRNPYIHWWPCCIQCQLV
ncbi:hypothetical protein BsWGS_01883 [Bradybaena similaris]